MKKNLVVLVVLLFAGISCAEASWLARDWLTKGNGWAEKGVLRIKAKDSGSVTLMLSADASGAVYITSLDLNLQLEMSGLDIDVWEFSNVLDMPQPLPVPAIEPTVSSPFVIPGIPFENENVKLTDYSLKIESASSGTLKANGEIVQYGIEFSLENVLWQKGAPEPATPDNKSGCNIGWAFLPFLLVPLFAVKFIRRTGRVV